MKDEERQAEVDALDNWDEDAAKAERKLCCHDCRYFTGIWGCSDHVGPYHKTCGEFDWS